MTRKDTISHMKYAGYHGDSSTFTRLLIERRGLSYENSMQAWRDGAKCKENGMKCGCRECNPTKGNQ